MSVYNLLIAGNPEVWWERETGSIVIEDPQRFEAEVIIVRVLWLRVVFS